MSDAYPGIGDSGARSKPATTWLWAAVRLALGVALLAYLSKSRLIDFSSLAKIATAWPVTLAALALVFADIVAMSARLCWLFRPQGLHLSLKNSLELTLVSSFFATFLPGAAGGDVAKLYYASRENKGRRAEIVTTIAFDRAVGLFSILLLPLFFAPFFVPLVRGVRVLQVLLLVTAALAAGMLVAFLLCLSSQPLIVRAAEWAWRVLPGREVPRRVLRAIGAYRSSAGILVAALAASLFANLTLIAATALAVLLFSPTSFSTKIGLVIPMGDVANNLPITPGGLGVGETAFDALFKVAGLSGGAQALLCWRIWRAMVSLVGLLVYLRGLRRSVFEASAAG